MAKRLLYAFTSLLILGIAIAISSYWLSHKPTAKHNQAAKIIPLVNITTLKPIKSHQLTVHAMGEVIPAQQVNLTSRINGMIINVSPNFIPGGLLKTGEKIVQLEQTDYKLLITQRENAREKALFDLTLEQGQQAIAKREFKLLNSHLDAQSKDLVLRKPHLALAKSSLRAADANLKQARLDLQRTQTNSPFNAVILETNAHVGSWVSTFSTGTPLVKLAGTDKFWILASIPVNKLNAIQFPDATHKQGATVKIYNHAAWGKKHYRTGIIKQLKADLETSGRMAEIIIEIDDPLSLKKANRQQPKLLLGSFIRIDIQGHTLNNIIALPEKVIHDKNTIWLLDSNNQLDIRSITPLWQAKKQLFIDANSLPKDSRLIQSYLSTPLQGMQLRHE